MARFTILELPRDVAEQFCRAALMRKHPSSEHLLLPELKNVAKKLRRFMPKVTEKPFVQTYSQRYRTIKVSERLLKSSMVI